MVRINSLGGKLIKDKDFFSTGAAEADPIFYYACFVGIATAVNDLVLLTNENRSAKAYAQKKDSKILMSTWTKKSEKEIKKAFSIWKKKWEKKESILYTLAKKPTSDLIKAWKFVDKVIASLYEDTYFIESIDPFADELENKLAQNLKATGIDEALFHELIAPVEPTKTQMASIDFNTIYTGKMKKTDYAKKYWYINGTWSGGSILNETMLSADFLPKLEKMNYSKRKKLQSELLKKLDKKTQDLFFLLRTFALWREERKSYAQMANVCYYEIAKEISKKETLNPKYIYWIRPDEVDKLKKNNSFVQERMSKCAFLFLPKTSPTQTITGAEAQEIINEFTPKKEVKEFKGTIACKGIIQGRVKVVIKSHQFGKFHKGEILVTTSTRPEYVPLMNISSAIITDEGGLTSHAAIISRELKKPCIVGTRIATHTLKDGDLIEVDANKGIVRKIK